MADSPSPSPSRADRLLDRIRNHRVAAVVIVISTVLGGLASLGDSVRTLAGWLPGAPTPSVAGPWKTDAVDFREAGPEHLRLDLREGPAGEVQGMLTFGGTDRLPARRLGVLEGHREGKYLKLRYDSGRYLIASGGKTEKWSESLAGEIGADELRLHLLIGPRPEVALMARRIESSSQRLAGRMALTVDGEPFDDHRSACERVLAGLQPPQTYHHSEPPTANGSVRCVGKRADGKVDFDMHDAGIRLSLICPPGSRPIPTDPNDPSRGGSLDRCECDGFRLARDGACLDPVEQQTRTP